MLERAMGACKQRRSPELGAAASPHGEACMRAGRRAGRLEWLNSALEADMNNGEVASELAVVAQDTGTSTRRSRRCARSR